MSLGYEEYEGDADDILGFNNESPFVEKLRIKSLEHDIVEHSTGFRKECKSVKSLR